MYTMERGLGSYIVSGIRSARSGSKANLYRPANILDIVAYNADQNKLSRIKEASHHRHFKSLDNDVIRSSVITFMTEVTRNSVIEREPNPELFNFLYDWYKFLYLTEKIHSCIHLLYMKELSSVLGFEPMNNYNETKAPYFDLQSGLFSASMTAHSGLSAEESFYWSNLLNADRSTLHYMTIAPEIRKAMLIHFLDYFKHHLSYFKDVLSHHVLSQVFS